MNVLSPSANPGEQRRAPPRPKGLELPQRGADPTLIEQFQRIFTERAKNPDPESPLGLLAKYQLVLQPYIPEDTSKKPIPPPSPNVFSGLSSNEFQTYLDAVASLVEEEGSPVAAFHIIRLEREEAFCQAVAEAFEKEYERLLGLFERLRADMAILKEIHEQIRRDIAVWIDISSPEEVSGALAHGRLMDEILMQSQTPFDWTRPWSLLDAVKRRLAWRRLEEDLSAFPFTDIESRYHIHIHRVGDGNGTPPSYEFIPGSPPLALEALYRRIPGRLEAVYNAPTILERRMRQLADLRAKIHRLKSEAVRAKTAGNVSAAASIEPASA